MGKGGGRGRGKGGCMSDLQEIGQEIQCMICCVCVMLVIGPILMLVGLSYLGEATTDTRSLQIAEWDAAAAAWTTSQQQQPFGGMQLAAQCSSCGGAASDHGVGVAASAPIAASADEALPDLREQVVLVHVGFGRVVVSGIQSIM
jgi:hypothetical protein